jgi:hypothetical protein
VGGGGIQYPVLITLKYKSTIASGPAYGVYYGVFLEQDFTFFFFLLFY